MQKVKINSFVADEVLKSAYCDKFNIVIKEYDEQRHETIHERVIVACNGLVAKTGNYSSLIKTMSEYCEEHNTEDIVAHYKRGMVRMIECLNTAGDVIRKITFTRATGVKFEL